MIFVTIGVSMPFDRLIKKMDQIALEYKDPIIMQVGYKGYKPQNARYVEALSHEAYMAHLQQADLVISHAGTGATMDLILNKKRCVLVPRMQKYGEHLNDHQLQHVEGWGNELGIKIVYDIDELDTLVHKIEDIPIPTPRKSTKESLVQAVRQVLLSSMKN